MDGWNDLIEWSEDIIEDQVKDEQKHLVSVFMKAVTTKAIVKGDIGKTPIDTGKLMANTVLSVNNIDNSSYDIEDKDGVDTYIKAMLVLGTAPVYSKVYIQNNASDGEMKYSLNADYIGWKNTPAYEFFTRSAIRTLEEAEDRNK